MDPYAPPTTIADTLAMLLMAVALVALWAGVVVWLLGLGRRGRR
jgi:hypothetical protein